MPVDQLAETEQQVRPVGRQDEEIAAANLRHGRDDIAIFEIGKGYGDDAGEVREWWRLSIAMTGAAEPPCLRAARYARWYPNRAR